MAFCFVASAYDGFLPCGNGLRRPFALRRWPMSAFRLVATAYVGLLLVAMAYSGLLPCNNGALMVMELRACRGQGFGDATLENVCRWLRGEAKSQTRLTVSAEPSQQQG